MANRKPRSDRLLTVDEIYRQPVGPASDPKSLYALLRFVRWRRAQLVRDDAEGADASQLSLYLLGG